jgi:hypothetical protein
MTLYFRKYKIRKLGNKRHKGITEQLAADERKEKKRVETARRTTLDKLERREGLWARLKNRLRATFGGKKFQQKAALMLGEFGDEPVMSGVGGGETTVETEVDGEVEEREGREEEAVGGEPWEGNYISVLEEYEEE